MDDCSSGLSLYLPLHISDHRSRQPYVASNQPSAILNYSEREEENLEKLAKGIIEFLYTLIKRREVSLFFSSYDERKNM